VERWSVEHRAFTVQTHFKTTILSFWFSGYFVGTSIFFGTIVSLAAILYCCGWETSEKQRLPQKIKPPGREPSLRTPENIERVRQVFVRSPRRSASRNVIALRMSDRTVRRILREDLNFHPYKMVMAQAINDHDTVNRKTVRFCWTLWITTALTTFSWRMEQIFIFVAILILKTEATGQPRTLAIITRNLYNLIRLLFGVVKHLLGWSAPISLKTKQAGQ